jgi:membrane protease YdiL (CAAX protease family)
VLRPDIWVEKIIPGLILFSMWIDGWFFPLILLPLSYAILVEKKSLDWLGFSRRGLRLAVAAGTLMGLFLSATYYPIFLHYLPSRELEELNSYKIFTDVFWYHLYEETSYRSFALTHFAQFDEPLLSTRNLTVNLSQTLLFISIHRHHFNAPLVLVPVSLLAFLNGLLFLRTRNIYGCFLSHSTVNGVALALGYLLA